MKISMSPQQKRNNIGFDLISMDNDENIYMAHFSVYRGIDKVSSLSIQLVEVDPGVI